MQYLCFLVIVILAPVRLRDYLLYAASNGMTNGDYIYFTFDFFPNAVDGILNLAGKGAWKGTL